MKREATSTLWVMLTIVTVVIVICTAVCVLGLTTYEITSRTQ